MISNDSKRLRAFVDHDICASAGVCVQRAPQSFHLNSDQLSEFNLASPIEPVELQRVADACPMGAITVGED